MTDARNHHFVPQAYLRNFAQGLKRQARVYTVDSVTGKAFTGMVRDVGASRDFNRIEADGHDPNFVENSFAPFEGSVAEAIRRIQDAGNFENEEDRILVLNLIALLSTRNPRFRKLTGDFMSDVAKKVASLTFATKERYESVQRRMKEDGLTSESKVSYEQVRDFVQSGEYDIVPNQTHQIGIELNAVDAVLDTLVDRKWTLFSPEADAGDFVTSDHPACLVDISSRPPSAIYRIGHGMTQTAVVFPLTRRLLLYGTFEGTDAVKTLDRYRVARMNSTVIQRADRQVYAYDDSFVYLRPNGIARGSLLASDELFLGNTEAGTGDRRSRRGRHPAKA